MRKNENRVNIEGYVYSHSLEVKTVQNQNSQNYGKEFINGNLNIAVDEDGLNVIPVHYTYISIDDKKKGYDTLKSIIDNSDRVWLNGGKDNAYKVRISGSVTLNDFYPNGGNELVSQRQVEGGFINFTDTLASLNQRNTFKIDIVLTKALRTEADPERHIDNDYVTLTGAAFNFRNDILPMDFIVRDPNGMEYFESFGVSSSNPVYTKIWGHVNCLTIKTTVTEESAFGAAEVRTIERKTKEWVVTGTAKVPYDFGDENVMTVEEMTTAVENRQIHLAEVKKRSDDYNANKKAKPAAATTAPKVNAGGFNF